MKTSFAALLILIIFQSSCASPKTAPPRTAQPPEGRIQLFPNGVYIHEVKILPKEGKPRNMKAVVSIQEDSIKLVGLSPFHTTLFRLEENRTTGEIVVKDFQPIPDRVKTEFDSFYRTLHRLLVLPLKEATSDQARDFVVEYAGGRPTLLKSKDSENRIEIGEYDSLGIPRRLRAIQPKFEALVRISHYELAK